MAERKVLSKYFPPDFDPSKIKRVKRDPTKQQVVRLMAPFSMACKSCGEYIYKGRKFNARKEYTTEDYYGIKIFRFYIKCTRCSAEITFKTDPKHTDYEMEHGATRNYAPWRDTEERAAKEADPLAYFAEEERMREEAEAGGSTQSRRADLEADPMATLEARQEESRREMQVLDALQDIRTRNARMDRVDTGDLADRLASKRKRNEEDAAQQLSVEDLERIRAEEEDEQLVRKYFAKDARGGTSSSIKRSVLEQEPEARHLLSDRARALLAPPSASAGSPSQQQQQQRHQPTKAPSPPPPTTKRTDEQEPTATPSTRTPASAPAPVHAARSAAMVGMAAAAAKKKNKAKANALGVVQKPKARV